MNSEYDVVVIGGGGAGLSGAVALARSLRSVVVIDDGTPRNARAGHVHNYLGRESTPPAELLQIGRSELVSYGGEVVDGRVTTVTGAAGDFTVGLEDGSSTRARAVLVAAGARDVLPDVPGLAERFGRDVLHCPYCHGYEVRGQRIGVLSTGPITTHQALLFRQLSDDVTVLLHDGPAPSAAESAQLRALGVRFVEGRVTGVDVQDDRLAAVDTSTGESIPLDVVVVSPRVNTRADFLTGIGIEPQDFEVNGHVVGTVIAADPSGLTAVPGIYAAGNVTNPMAQVMTSAAAGLTAGARINADLVMAGATARAAE